MQRSNGFQPGAPRAPVPPHQEIWFGNNGNNKINDEKGCTSRGPTSLQVANQEIIEQYPEALTGIANDEKPVIVTMEQTRKKGYPMGDFLRNKGKWWGPRCY